MVTAVSDTEREMELNRELKAETMNALLTAPRSEVAVAEPEIVGEEGAAEVEVSPAVPDRATFMTVLGTGVRFVHTTGRFLAAIDKWMGGPEKSERARNNMEIHKEEMWRKGLRA